jgi:hypothetical protein
VLFDDRGGNPAKAESAVDYSADLVEADADSVFVPVLADPAREVFEVTPYDGSQLPGLCLLDPQMIMVECTTGHEQFAALLDQIPR